MSESWFVDGGWECHCGPVPPYPSDYPGPCRRCFALAPVKQKADSPLPRETLLTPEMAAVIEAAKAQESELHRLLELGVNERPDAHTCLEFARSKSGIKEAVTTLRALEGDA